MRKVNLNKLYESHNPPEDTSVLWVDRDENTGDIKAIHRFKKGAWEPYLISLDYLKSDETKNS